PRGAAAAARAGRAGVPQATPHAGPGLRPGTGRPAQTPRPSPEARPMSAAPGLFRPPAPQNEPVKDYAPGSPEREELRVRLEQMRAEQLDIPLVIGGEEVRTRETFEAVMPHDRNHVLAKVHKGSSPHVEQAIK